MQPHSDDDSGAIVNRTDDAPRDLPWRAFAASALLAFGLQCPAVVQAKCELKVIELPVKMVGTRATAMVGINGTQVPLMVDSGSSFSLLTEATASQLKLRLRESIRIDGVVGSADARLTRVAHLGLSDGDLANIEFIVGGNELGAGSMGILGRNILSFADTEYDLAHGMIRMVIPTDDCEKSNMAYWANDTSVSVVELLPQSRTKTPAIRANLLLNGHKVTALFDTGASTTVSLAAAHKAGVKDADMKAQGRMSGIGRGKTNSWTASFDRVELGGEAILHNRLPVGDFDLDDADMMLGIDFFLSHHIYVSRQQSRIYSTYNGGPVFALNANDPASTAASGADTGQAPGDALTADDYARRGAASLARGDTASALSDLDRACALSPDTASFFATRASVHLARKERDKALADLDTALRLDPGQAEARMRRASMHTGKTERDLALDDLSVLDKTLPPQSQLRKTMAQVYNGLRMPAQALAQWNQWIAANPRDIGLEQAYNGRCWARIQLNIELDKAFDDCDEAVDADSKNPNYAGTRAWAYLRLGKWAKAVADFDRALAGRPNAPWWLYGRGLAHLNLGQAALGQADLAEARQAQPDVDAAIKREGLPLAPDATP
jgi:tetratricopeptide (TPR) repeat protein/predicted aspartyl protease